MRKSKHQKQISRRRTLLLIALLPYYAIWFFLFYAAHTATQEEAGAAFALGLIVTAVLCFVPYFIYYLSKCINSTVETQTDYALALFFVLLPLGIVFLDYKLNTLRTPKLIVN